MSAPQQQDKIQFLPLANEISKPFVIANVSPVSPQFNAQQSRKDSTVSEVDLDLVDELTTAVKDSSVPTLSVL